MKRINYILFFLLLGWQVSFSQEMNDDDFDQLIEDILNDDKDVDVEEIFESESESINYNSFENNQPQKEYLETPIDKKNFDRNKWKKIKRRVVDDVIDEEGNYDSDSPYGQQKLQDQDNPYQRSEKNYQKYWDEKQENSKEVKTRPRKTRENRQRSNRSSNPMSVSPLVGQILLIIVVLILVFLIFYLFFKAPIDKKAKKIDQDLSEISPTEIPKSELELMLDKALAQEDYRKAIRIYFIFIIRALSKKGWISWEKEKTNFSYLSEMRKNKFYNDFETSVSVYEIVWYGKRILNKQTYLELEPKFKTLIQQLEK